MVVVVVGVVVLASGGVGDKSLKYKRKSCNLYQQYIRTIVP